MNATVDPVQALFDRRPKIEAVSFNNNWLIVEGGSTFVIQEYLDADHEPMDDNFNDASYYVIALSSDDEFIVIPSSAYYMPTYADN